MLVAGALAVIGLVVGAVLAEPGNLVGNTLPSMAIFGVAGLVVGVVIWRIQARGRHAR